MFVMGLGVYVGFFFLRFCVLFLGFLKVCFLVIVRLVMFFLFCSIRFLYCCFGLYVAAAHYFVCYLGLRVVFFGVYRW